MINKIPSIISRDNLPESIKDQLSKITDKGKRRSHVRFIAAALGSIPWVGGFLGALSAKDAEKEQGEINELQQLWLQEHEEKVHKLAFTFFQILSRLETFGEEIQSRLESPQYLNLVRKGFRTWDQADTEEKRELIRKLLTSAGATKLCPDELVRLFIDWIHKYHESHFKVIKEVYQNPRITRGEIWENIYGAKPRENSAEADLFRLLVDDLSQGRVIRQERQTDGSGNFLKKQRKTSTKGSRTMTSAFENSKRYVLTELGKQFVHYTMEELVTRIDVPQNGVDINI
ncbi:MAG: hypothetical protein HN726_03925 [Candidatus Magasanikbacteria bacterium]|jgi:hypothetical protein|nr:hypothetical protein [Candidatus Magasanikbacteria bacterium]MBT4221164.1 hypothetical protein [Candidatus Magasanikbacteria bacterium]MBT4350266.1 hypothetical protein [Candidatus Magasanikbacteria bacterium]MBT4541692.1 hypothetical protein [Candidatus Magasanikbacteria bacterium]MBT6253331.1 hypothetical protein [Candidatus Magasanikbacteria bacterium]